MFSGLSSIIISSGLGGCILEKPVNVNSFSIIDDLLGSFVASFNVATKVNLPSSSLGKIEEMFKFAFQL